MTMKDYISIAAALNRVHGELGYGAVNRVANELADTLAEDNPRFDRAQFMEAVNTVPAYQR